MFIESIRARRAIERRFSAIGYRPGAETWHQLNLAVARDIQARQLPPNVAVPSRRRALRFISTVYRATGSATLAVSALFRAGSWTSSGGSFRLADAVGVDVAAMVRDGIAGGEFNLLEVGGAWAGFHPRQQPAETLSLAALAKMHGSVLGGRLNLHFTNLTQWHTGLPVGVTEHPYVTAAGLSSVATAGVEPATIDLIYSQAAAYFEPDIEAFIRSASALLRPGGYLLFNYTTEAESEVSRAIATHGLECERSTLLGGMNGKVSLFAKRLAASAAAIPSRNRLETVAALALGTAA